RRFEHDRGDVVLVGADVEDGVVELACQGERPERGALLDHGIGGGGRRRRRPPPEGGRQPAGPPWLRPHGRKCAALPPHPSPRRGSIWRRLPARAFSPPPRAGTRAPPRRPAASPPRACP